MNQKQVLFNLEDVSADKKLDLYLQAQRRDSKILNLRVFLNIIEDGSCILILAFTVLVLFSASINKALTDWYQSISWLQPVEALTLNSSSESLKVESSKSVISPIKDLTIEDAFKNCDSTSSNICVSSEQGSRVHPISGQSSEHNGIDIAAPEGISVVAVEDGVISKVWNQEGLGGLIVELVPNSNKNLTIKYLHLSKQSVKEGQKISKGEIIGKVGNTGGSTGSHLDIRIWDSKSNSWIKVREYFKAG